MNLAQDLLRKSQGHIHTMPESVMTKRQLAILGTSNRPATGKYVDENGKPTTSLAIAIKYKTGQAKVKKAFELGSTEKAYEFLRTDQRKNNGKRNVYFTNDGKSISSKALGDFFSVSRTTIQRAYRKFDKDPVKANEYLMQMYFVDRC